jgi:hypothetical protein
MLLLVGLFLLPIALSCSSEEVGIASDTSGERIGRFVEYGLATGLPLPVQ